MKATTKAARELTVLNRYEVKQDCPEKGLHKGDVVLHIRNDKGAEYYTTLRRNKVHSCNCKATRKCYHITKCAEMENARIALRKEVASQFSAKHAPSWLVELVNKGVVVAPKVVHTVAQPVDDILDRHAELMRQGAYNLNGAQQSAGLLMQLPSRKAKAS